MDCCRSRARTCTGEFTDAMTCPTRQYFKRVFNARSTGDASIVIILLGSVELR